MKLFVTTEAFQRLNVGFVLDEGIASPNDEIPVFYGERSQWHIEFVCSGVTGHGSLLPSATAGEKLRRIVNRMMDFRDEQVARLASDPALTLGDVTTVNLTMLSGGVQPNVLPETLSAIFDIRIAADVDHDEFEAMVGTHLQCLIPYSCDFTGFIRPIRDGSNDERFPITDKIAFVWILFCEKKSYLR